MLSGNESIFLRLSISGLSRYSSCCRNAVKDLKKNLLENNGGQTYNSFFVDYPVHITIRFFINHLYRDTINRIDLDNYAKPIIDALTGIYYKDDKQVRRLYLSTKPSQDEYVLVRISYYATLKESMRLQLEMIKRGQNATNEVSLCEVTA